MSIRERSSLPGSRRSWTALLAAVFVVLSGLVAPASPVQAQAATFTNPIRASGADPWMTYYDGNYYLMTTPYSGPLRMSRAPTIAALKTASPVSVFSAHAPGRDNLIWAPEFHLLNGPNGPRWYIYYSAGPGEVADQRVHVLESAGTDPMGPYTYRGMLFSATNWWSIDASVLTINDQLYVVWSGTPGGTTYTGAPSVYITALTNPWTAGTTRLQLSTPTLDWERQLWSINEAPVGLQRNGRTFVVYSASGCGGPDYKLGLLSYNGGDVLSASSWTKRPTPIFQRNDAAGVYGPGHNGFFTSPDGTEDWIVYHANSSAADGCGSSRSTRIQRFGWNADGTPSLGAPVGAGVPLAVPSGEPGGSNDPTIAFNARHSFRSVNFPDRYLRHRDGLGYLEPVSSASSSAAKQDATFTAVPGLADASCYSFAAVNANGYLRHADYRLQLSADNNTDLFRQDATFCARPGLAGAGSLSLESHNFPGRYLRHAGFELRIDPFEDNATYRADASFTRVDPWS